MAKTKAKSKWDVQHEDHRGKVYKIRVKALTNRDGLSLEQLRLSVAARLGAETSGLDDAATEALRLVQYWPALRYGTEEAEGIEIPETEDQFWAIPETVMLVWFEAVVEANPQLGVPFLEVRRMLDEALAKLKESGSPDTSRAVAPASNGSANG